MVKFVGYIEYKYGRSDENGRTCKYFDLIANSVDEAMNEIESLMSDDVFLGGIYVKACKKIKVDSHVSYVKYVRKFVNRGTGFHVADDKHREHVWIVERQEIKVGKNVDIFYEYK